MMSEIDKGPAGDTLEEFLDQVGIAKDVYDTAVKRVVAWQFEEARKARELSKKEMAASMGTSRSQLDRVLDPENVAVSIELLNRAALALGKRLKIELLDGP